MSTAEVRSTDVTGDVSVGKIDMKLEVVTVPVSDVDRAKRFYQSLGWRLDIDLVVSDVKEQPKPPGFPDFLGRSYFAYASFSDPDGNRWLLQEVTKRLPGREWDD